MNKWVVGVAGASGAIYAKLLIQTLLKNKSQAGSFALVFSKTAKDIWSHELNEALPTDESIEHYDSNDFNAPFASGSSQYTGMIVCPCSMGMLGRIANGISDDLIARAADVMLKERRKLILVPRETPFHFIHLQNMERLTLSGAVVCPAIPSFYSKPATIEEAAQTVIDRVMDLAGFEIQTKRWGEKDTKF